MMRARAFGARRRARADDLPLGCDDAVRSGALRGIDRALRELDGRRLVSPAEVVNLLLDLRSAIMLDELSDHLGVH